MRRELHPRHFPIIVGACFLAALSGMLIGTSMILPSRLALLFIGVATFALTLKLMIQAWRYLSQMIRKNVSTLQIAPNPKGALTMLS